MKETPKGKEERNMTAFIKGDILANLKPVQNFSNYWLLIPTE